MDVSKHCMSCYRTNSLWDIKNHYNSQQPIYMDNRLCTYTNCNNKMKTINASITNDICCFKQTFHYLFDLQ